MITLAEASKRTGHGVIYRGEEDGVITGVSAQYVFVRYAGDTGSKATSPADLEFLAEVPDGQ